MRLIESPEITQEIKQYFPAFYNDTAHLYSLNENNEDVGVYGVKKLSNNICEIFLCIFQDFRFKIPYRETLKLVLSFPFTLGFKVILISTKEKSIETLLRQCNKLGVKFMGFLNNKFWFEIRKESI